MKNGYNIVGWIMSPETTLGNGPNISKPYWQILETKSIRQDGRAITQRVFWKQNPNQEWKIAALLLIGLYFQNSHWETVPKFLPGYFFRIFDISNVETLRIFEALFLFDFKNTLQEWRVNQWIIVQKIIAIWSVQIPNKSLAWSGFQGRLPTCTVTSRWPSGSWNL